MSYIVDGVDGDVILLLVDINWSNFFLKNKQSYPTNSSDYFKTGL